MLMCIFEQVLPALRAAAGRARERAVEAKRGRSADLLVRYLRDAQEAAAQHAAAAAAAAGILAGGSEHQQVRAP
jgi:hypothetical protein